MKNKIKLLNKLRAAMDSTELMAPVLAPDTSSNNDELGGEGVWLNQISNLLLEMPKNSTT